MAGVEYTTQASLTAYIFTSYSTRVTQASLTLGAYTNYIHRVTQASIAASIYTNYVIRVAQASIVAWVLKCDSASYVPPAPTGLITLTATPGNVGEQWIDMSWTPLDNSTYTLQRGTTNGVYPTTLLTASSLLAYHDTGVAFNTQYFYLLTATNACGDDSVSNDATASPGCDLPSRPLRLHATANQTGGVDLLWNTAAGATTYQVWRGTTTGGETVLVSGLTATSYTDAAVPAGSTVYYVVVAVNLCGSSMNSNEASSSVSCCSRYEDGADCSTVYTQGPDCDTTYTTEGC
jgi:hypothetical protein